MATKPLLSIITVSAFDHDRLKRTLVSLQDLPIEIEHVVVIPKTDVESRQLWATSDKESTTNMQLTHDENEGVYAAMNIGARSAHGEYICFWNAGDELISKNALSQLMSSLNIARPVWLICQGEFSWRGPQSMEPSQLHNFVLHRPESFISHQTVVASKEQFMKIGGFDSSYKVAADTAQITQLSSLSVPHFEPMPVVRVETPQFASRHHRRARLEVILVAFRNLRGSDRLKAVVNIFRNEFHNFSKDEK